jgi:hypothetical protein
LRVDPLSRFAGALVLACRVIAWISALAMNAPVVAHVARGSQAYLGFFADDFFYYTVVIDRFLATSRLTFDGVHATNGFHPLWFAVLALLRLSFGAGAAFYVALAALDAALAIATFELYVRLGRAVGVRAPIAFVCAALLAKATNHLVLDGMETSLALPAIAALLLAIARTDRLTPRRAMVLGLLSSLAALSRLDVSILVALVVAGYAAFARDSMRDKLRCGAAFGVGGLAFPAYLAFNVVAFGALLPTSATAKQMSTSFGLNGEFLRFDQSYIGDKGIYLPILALALFFSRWRVEGTPAARFAVGVGLLFPAIYYAICALRSPWICFYWYTYAQYATAFLGLATIGEAIARRVGDRRLRWGASVCASAAVARVLWGSIDLGRHYAFHFDVADNPITANAFTLARVLRDRPGVYAMGDKAGNVANLLAQPIVQMEGLVADHALLQRIREQRPLAEALRDYRADYLILSIGPNSPLPKRDGCWDVTQPNVHESGERAPKMRGRICAEPFVDYEVPDGAHPWSKYRAIRIHTYVFDLRVAKVEPADR